MIPLSWLTLLLAGRWAVGEESIIARGQCWDEALEFFNTKRAQEAPTALEKLPSKESPCKAFSDVDKKIISLLMIECHSKHLHSADDRGFPQKSDFIIQLGDILQNSHESNSFELVTNDKIRTLSEHQFTVYVSFYNHLESTCYQIHSAIWQEKTDSLIVDLSYSAAAALNKMDSSLKMHNDLMLAQELSLTQQRSLAAQSAQLHETIEGGHTRLENVFGDLREQVEAERIRFNAMFKDLFNVFHRILSFQTFIKTRVMDMQTSLVYVGALILTFYLTANSRTSSARSKLYLVWTVMGISEMIAVRVGLWMELDENRTSTAISLIRHSGLAISFLFWVREFFIYVDPHSKALVQLTAEFHRLRSQLEHHQNASKLALQQYERVSSMSEECNLNFAGKFPKEIENCGKVCPDSPMTTPEYFRRDFSAARRNENAYVTDFSRATKKHAWDIQPCSPSPSSRRGSFRGCALDARKSNKSFSNLGVMTTSRRTSQLLPKEKLDEKKCEFLDFLSTSAAQSVAEAQEDRERRLLGHPRFP